ncbi:hypothetical protein [Pseudodonghicola xiamenensis]|uniref:Uncharacterized protein n=1 Tax=Pseudodonghicola xiamenensis TaxID=337702 RepID=A0A8J3H7C1_9RHOB|nr:hypothetical protein [Pseudodonghicola xiamenensis]GHG95830.1 hypothetical protein GCM10010961_29870 [Pseudodonghicola xiamenensis]
MSANSDAHHDDLPSTKATIWIFVAVAIFVALWATAIALFGVPGLYIPALALVPVVGLLIVLVSLG